jgi:hypothetical protein
VRRASSRCSDVVLILLWETWRANYAWEGQIHFGDRVQWGELQGNERCTGLMEPGGRGDRPPVGFEFSYDSR